MDVVVGNRRENNINHEKGVQRLKVEPFGRTKVSLVALDEIAEMLASQNDVLPDQGLASGCKKPLSELWQLIFGHNGEKTGITAP